jgi:hypothetical protein
MQTPTFAPVPHAGLSVYRAGEAAPSWTPGDFILTRGDSIFSRLIRFGERLRIHGADRRYAWFNHAALVVGTDGSIVEALGGGVAAQNAAKYTPDHYVVVHVGADQHDVKKMLDFASWVTEHRAKYGYLTIASIVFTLLTGAKFTFFIDGEFICSGFVARAMERSGAIFSRDPVHITPADLAKYYNAQPPASDAPAQQAA